MSFYSPFSF